MFQSEDDELESVSEAESNPNEDAKSYQSGADELGEEQVCLSRVFLRGGGDYYQKISSIF